MDQKQLETSALQLDAAKRRFRESAIQLYFRCVEAYWWKYDRKREQAEQFEGRRLGDLEKKTLVSDVLAESSRHHLLSALQTLDEPFRWILDTATRDQDKWPSSSPAHRARELAQEAVSALFPKDLLQFSNFLIEPDGQLSDDALPKFPIPQADHGHYRELGMCLVSPFERALHEKLQQLADISVLETRLTTTVENRTGTRRSKGGRLTRAALIRQKVIFGALQMNLKGVKYCQELDRRNLPVPAEWREQGPDTFEKAYRSGEPWRKKIQDQKSKSRKQYQDMSPKQREEIIQGVALKTSRTR